METNGLVIVDKLSCSKFMFACNKLWWIWILDNVADRSRLTCSFGMILFALKRKIRPLTANVKTSNANMREITPKGVNYFLLIWSYFFVSSILWQNVIVILNIVREMIKRTISMRTENVFILMEQVIPFITNRNNCPFF